MTKFSGGTKNRGPKSYTILRNQIDHFKAIKVDENKDEDEEGDEDEEVDVDHKGDFVDQLDDNTEDEESYEEVD